MASVALSSKAVGSVVKLNVNGAAKEFIVVHQGKPSSLYDDSCNGTWLLMKDIYENRAWHSSNSNSYKASTIHSYLNSTFLNLFDADIKAQIKTVKIPYVNGTADSAVASGSSGLSAQIFLLSGYEVGWTTSDSSYFPVDGAKLSYFTASSGGNSKRIAYLNGTATYWWLRSPGTSNTYYAWLVYSDGDYSSGFGCSNSFGVRPALVLPSTLLVSDDGSVQTNTPPTITSTSGASGVNLGSKTAGFNFQYTVADADGDSLTITEKLDGVTKRSFTAASGSTQTFQAVTAANFQKVLNGSHTMSIVVSDGSESVTFTATFTKAVYSASITLKTPLTVEGDITAAVLGVVGSIPSDANYKVEVTNNAKDSSPVWQDVTAEAKSGANIVFKNSTATNGAAFNFRITVSRGSSNTSGYISAINGAFQ